MRSADASGTPDARAGRVEIRLILVPVDFSAQSDAAFEYALALAGKLGARLDLLHVFQVPAFAFPDAAVAIPTETLVEVQKAAEARLGTLQKRAEQAGVPATTDLFEGAPFVEIVRAARAREVDLIVMGTHGRTGLRHALLGSVAEKVVRKAPCPVLVVRSPDAKFEPP